MDDQSVARTRGAMRFRKLRIAISVLFLTTGTILCAFWYHSFDTTAHARANQIASRPISSTQSVAVASEWGKVFLGMYNTHAYFTGPWQVFHAIDGSWQSHGSFGRFYFGTTADSVKFIIPHWFLILFCGIVAVAAIFHRPFQFRLRSLLATTTVVAIEFGLMAYLLRK